MEQRLKAYLGVSPCKHSLNVSPTLKLDITDMLQLLRAAKGCSLLMEKSHNIKKRFAYSNTHHPIAFAMSSSFTCKPQSIMATFCSFKLRFSRDT
jgi:hypothetical protein